MLDVIGLVHLVCAVTALIAGALIFAMTKGTRTHILFGRIYVVSMLLLNLTALCLYRLFGGFGPFHVLAFVSLITLVMGYRAVRRRRPEKTWLAEHYHWMCWSYVGLLAAGVSEFVVRVESLRLWINSWMNFGLAVFIASVVVCIVGGALIRGLEERVMKNIRPPDSK